MKKRRQQPVLTNQIQLGSNMNMNYFFLNQGFSIDLPTFVCEHFFLSCLAIDYLRCVYQAKVMTSGFQETKSAGEYNIVKDKTEYDLVYNHREYKDVLETKQYKYL